MRIDQKYAVIVAALDESGRLQLRGQPRYDGLKHTVSNRRTVLQALHALDTFDWCNVPNDLIRDLAGMQSPDDAAVYNSTQQRLAQFSNENLMEAPPLEVLKGAVQEYSEDLFEVLIACERMSENFRLGQRAAELAETVVVEGSVKEQVMGGSLVFGVEFPEDGQPIWAVAIWLLRKMVQAITSGTWEGIRAAADHLRADQAEREAAFREGVAAAFGNEIREALEPFGERTGDAIHLAMEMHNLTAEGCEFDYSSRIQRERKISIGEVSLQIDAEPVSQQQAKECLENAGAVWSSIQGRLGRRLPSAADVDDQPVPNGESVPSPPGESFQETTNEGSSPDAPSVASK